MPGKKTNRHYSKRSLGQNFLVDESYIARILAAVSPAKGDTVVEIGPGRGAITEGLVASGARVIAVELDRDLIAPLREHFAGSTNFAVVELNALEADFTDLVAASAGATKLVANLPYYISTAILQRLIEHRDAFSSMVLMFQREVVERIAAEPGNSDRGFLTVLVEAAFNVEHLFDVPPVAFRPSPKVFSSVVRLSPKDSTIEDHADFRQLLSSAFAHKRKNILNNLKLRFPNAGSALASAGIDPRRRAETLSLDEWNNLLRRLKAV
jgi:16S rRNA (adenine1518-N6/adenine1519-N6)-dimethyltransferase